MAGQTDNTVILEALNQTVQAINDLITSIAALALSPTINVAAPDVTVTPTINNTVNCSCSCNGNAGSELDGGAGDQGQEPPEGYTEPDPNTEDRKCKVANLIHDQMVDLVQRLAVMDADQYASIGFSLTLGIVGSAIGSLAFPGAGTLVGAVVGVAVGIATQLVSGGVLLDLSDVSTILSTNQEDLVNALYNATDAASARGAYVGIIAADGATVVEQQIFNLALTNDFLNLLFFTIPDYEPTIAAYTGTVDCEYSPVLEWTFDSGVNGWAFVDGSIAPDYAVGSFATDGGAGGANSAGHLRITEHQENNGSFSSRWSYTFPEGFMPVVGENTVISALCKMTNEGGYGRMQLILNHSDETTEGAEVYNTAWDTISFSYAAHSDSWGKSLERIDLIANRTGTGSPGHIIDFDSVTVSGTS